MLENSIFGIAVLGTITLGNVALGYLDLGSLGFEKISDIFFWCLLTAILTAIVHYAFVLAYPYLVMSVAIRRGTKMLGKNSITHKPKPTAEFRDVVRPSPDLIYSGCVFDVSEAPLRIQATLPGTYMSLSLYGNNTDNFFGINDLEIDGTRLELLLIGPKSLVVGDGSIPIVRAPSNRGIMLFRYFVSDGAEAEKVEAARRQTVLTSAPSLKRQKVAAG